MFLFVPYDETIPNCIVGCSHRDLGRNQIGLITLDLTEKNKSEKPRGTLVRLLGPVGDVDAERFAILYQHCPDATKKVKDTDISVLSSESRVEISANTGWQTFHVDPPGCRDIDDAMAFHPEKGWAITIADAAAAVLPNTPIDDRAKSIGATFYDLNGVVVQPMLPASISEGTSSLIPGSPRLGITLMVDSGIFVLSLITVAESYTYDSVLGHPLLEGAEPHEWIEHAMIRYNTAVARLLREHSTGILRTQTQGDAEAMAHWSSIDPALKFMAMEAASYECANPLMEQSHSSLGLEAYCHASSPLRRYADLVNQRCLKHILSGTAVPVDTILPTHLNQRMKANRRYSRDLLFLEKITPGRIHMISVVWLSDTQVWVPEWKRILRINHVPSEKKPCISIFCDPTKRNWKQRILTAETVIQPLT
jgi:exoribonuclease R